MRRIIFLLVLAVVALPAIGVAAKKKTSAVRKTSKTPAKKLVRTTKATSVVKKTLATPPSRKRLVRKVSTSRRYYRQTWMEPTFADSTMGDRIEGEDLIVRRAAVEALGPYNGSVLVTDARTGRVLTIVNQKVAMRSGFTPCSTIKLVTSIAGLVEGVITPETSLKITRRGRMGLTEALARSNNPYFSMVGRELGFEKVAYYARMLGIGEKAGIDIEGEQAGLFPQDEPAASAGGLGLMSYCGTGIDMTPLQLSALLSMIANDGTLNWLQYPRTKADVEAFQPQVKRRMDLQKVVEQMLPGMEGAVEWGSGQRARKNAESDEQIYGKTGTCTHSDQRTHLGWFGAFNKVGNRRLVVVVLLTGGRPVNGPVASGIAGAVYRILNGQNYYAQSDSAAPVAALPSVSSEVPALPETQ